MANRMKWLWGAIFVAVVSLAFAPNQALAFPVLNFGKLVPNLNFAYGNTIDFLYNLIFWIVTFFFVATEGALLWFMFAYRKRDGHKAHYTHGSKGAELTMALIPALILIGLAIGQQKTWSYIRSEIPAVSPNNTVEVFAEQFAWNFRYAGPDGKFGGDDDIMTINQLHLPVGQKFVVHLAAKDVIHSFFIPYARIKQDAVPGMLNRNWFEIDKVACWDLKTQEMVFFTAEEIKSKKVALNGFNMQQEKVGIAGKKIYSYKPASDAKTISLLYQGKVEEKPVGEAEYVQHPLEIACAQLCGLGHYRMIGYVVVDTPETYDRWMKQSVKDKLRSGDAKWAIWDKYFPQYNSAI